MLYLGLDVHGKWTTMVGLDPETGEVVERKRVANEPEEMSAVLEALPGPLYGVMEAGTNSWAMYRGLERYFEELVVADPVRLWERRRDRGAKTDRRDALRMAQMLYRGEITGLYIPDERTQDLRVLVRSKVRSTRWVTKLVNEIGSLLRSWGHVNQRSLLSRRGAEQLGQIELPGRSGRILQLWREMLRKAQEIEQELEQAVKQEAGVEPECALLRTVPSVGPFTALLVRAEVGDIRRFRSPSALVSYAGWAPQVNQSGEKCSYGKLVPWGNRWLRYALGLLANRISRSRKKTRLHRLYWRACLRGHDTNAAKCSVARKTTELVWHMLMHREPWQEVPVEERVTLPA
jgi:transposase